MNDQLQYPAIPAQAGVIALFKKITKEDDEGANTDHARSPVVAFAADGAPLVVETTEGRDSRFLVRADSDDSYSGMTYERSAYGSFVSRDENYSGRFTEWDIAALDMVALRALELAGKRQLTRATRAYRSDLRDVPTWEVHAHLKIINVDQALSGAYTLFYASLPGHEQELRVIDDYVRERISTQRLHDNKKLLNMLAESGLPRHS